MKTKHFLGSIFFMLLPCLLFGQLIPGPGYDFVIEKGELMHILRLNDSSYVYALQSEKKAGPHIISVIECDQDFHTRHRIELLSDSAILLKDIHTDGKGSYFLAGGFQGQLHLRVEDSLLSLRSSGEYDGFLVQFNKQKAERIYQMGDRSYDCIDAVRIDTKGNILVVGTFQRSTQLFHKKGSKRIIGPEEYHIFVAKYSVDDTLSWVRVVSDTKKHFPIRASLHQDGRLSLNARCVYYIEPLHKNKEVPHFNYSNHSPDYIISLTPDGEFRGLRYFRDIQMKGIHSYLDKGLLCYGSFRHRKGFPLQFQKPKGKNDAFVTLKDPQGIVWSRTIGDAGNESIEHLELLPSKSMIAFGYFDKKLSYAEGDSLLRSANNKAPFMAYLGPYDPEPILFPGIYIPPKASPFYLPYSKGVWIVYTTQEGDSTHIHFRGVEEEPFAPSAKLPYTSIYPPPTPGKEHKNLRSKKGFYANMIFPQEKTLYLGPQLSLGGYYGIRFYRIGLGVFASFQRGLTPQILHYGIGADTLDSHKGRIGAQQGAELTLYPYVKEDKHISLFVSASRATNHYSLLDMLYNEYSVKPRVAAPAYGAGIRYMMHDPDKDWNLGFQFKYQYIRYRDYGLKGASYHYMSVGVIYGVFESPYLP